MELGINFFDTANVYSNGMSEEVTGRALRDFARREEVVIATKVRFATGYGANNQGLSRKHILSAIVLRVSQLAEARGLPMAQAALAWMLAKPTVTAPIIGATRPRHLDDAVAALCVTLRKRFCSWKKRTAPIL